ncbi:MAG TPA: carboxypeptidase regulatory-like domain-containing protein, partial [Anaerolineae bacterium]|nr:carboxypeptidase regulatory-like domain-containing protein [Anaerolineae bacterium]
MFRKSVMKRVRLIALAVLMLALVTVACAPQPAATLSPTATPLPAKTPTATPTQAPTPRPTDTPMPTPTPVPSLSGRVTDAPTGQGIGGARIEAGPAGNGGPGMREWNHTAITASDGSYAMFDLPAGDYLVRIVATGYAREYWDNATPSDEATLVTVSTGVTLAGIDFALTEGGSISGHIYQSDGTTPIVGAWVLVRPSKYVSDDGFWATTDAEGAYSVAGLPLGNF